MSSFSQTWTMNIQSRLCALSLMHGLFKTILQLKLLYQLKALCPRRMAWSFVSLENGSKLHSQTPEQWMCRAEASPGSLMHGLFKTTFQVKLLYLTWSCLLGDFNNEHAELRLLQFHLYHYDVTVYHYDVLLLYVLMYMYGSMIDNSEASLFGWILYYVEVHYKWCPHGDEMRW